MLEVGHVAKSDTNSQQGWSFRGIDTIYQKCQKAFAKHEVIPGAEIIRYDQVEVKSARGNQGWYLTAHVRVHFNSEEGSTFMDTLGTSTDYGDKVGGQVMSMIMKKAIIDVLLLPINGPDSDSEIKETVSWTKLTQERFMKGVEAIKKGYEKVNESADGVGIKYQGNYIWLTLAQYSQLTK